MGENKRGSSKMLPGPWSVAVAARLAPIVDARKGRRRQFAKDSGIAEGRISKLLNGVSAWYLEDVDVFCTVLDIDPVAFLDEVIATRTPARDELALAADRNDQAIDTETDEDQL